MRLMVVGSGGREHALVWKLAQSPLVKKIFVAPGNPGMKNLAQLVDLAADDCPALVRFCLQEKIDLCVVGPELPLSLGLVDQLTAAGVTALGPCQFAAQLESSKDFSKRLMQEAGVPTAAFASFHSLKDAVDFVSKVSWPAMVVKASELAAGKGVIVCDSKQEACEALELLMNSSAYGVVAKTVIVEERLRGVEVSAFFLCDGRQSRFLGLAQDHKRLLNNDQGPNTGGMGAFSPVLWCSEDFPQRVQKQVVAPVLKQMAQLGQPFKGILFVGLMVCGDEFFVLEFNTRFGDPEAQVLLPLVDEDILPWFLAAAQGRLQELPLQIKGRPGSCVHVVKAAKGYPGVKGMKVQKGELVNVSGPLEEGVLCFFAGVAESQGQLITSGGRVLGLTAQGKDQRQAREKCYQNLSQVSFPGEQWREDIGKE